MKEGNRIPRFVFAVTNCISYDQRVLKMAGTAKSTGADITIVGRRIGYHSRNERIPYRTRRFRMIFRKGFLLYMFYNIRLFLFLLFHRFDIIVSNDLDTLPASWMASKIKSSSLVYDSHEYFTGVPELLGRRTVTAVWKKIEGAVFPGLKNVITVSDSIADLYQQQYGIRPMVVRNCSAGVRGIEPYSRKELGVGDDCLILILQGCGINIHKGAEELIMAMKDLPGSCLFIVGSGDVVESLKIKSVSEGLEGRIRFIPVMPWEEMMRYTLAADIGLSLERDTNVNYRFSLPNKLFDYISAGLPVIAGDLPEISGILSGYDCGIIIPRITPGEIAEAVSLLNSNRDLLNVLKQNSKTAAADLNWDKESVKVRELYLNLEAEAR